MEPSPLRIYFSLALTWLPKIYLLFHHAYKVLGEILIVV